MEYNVQYGVILTGAVGVDGEASLRGAVVGAGEANGQPPKLVRW